MKLEEVLNKKLLKRQQTGNLRHLKISADLIDFTSNDYLGLARSKELQKEIHEATAHLPIGSTGSRLLSGNLPIHEENESYLADLFGGESAILFNSGYMANLAVLSSLPQKGDTILYDELSHASIKDGLRLSLASRYAFRHNDMDDLERKITKSSGQIFIVVEAIYSMDGDECPLKELIALSNKHGAAMILDEAHSTGIYGSGGSGLANEQGMAGDIFCRIYTFGKAMGVHGALVVGSRKMTQYLMNFSRPFIYTTAMPPHSVISIKVAFDYLKRNIHLQNTLKDNIDYFLKDSRNIDDKYIRTKSNHAIQGIITPGNEHAKELSSILGKSGLDVRPILSPTVSEGSERLRVSIHTFNKRSEIKLLIDTLAAAK